MYPDTKLLLLFSTIFKKKRRESSRQSSSLPPLHTTAAGKKIVHKWIHSFARVEFAPNRKTNCKYFHGSHHQMKIYRLQVFNFIKHQSIKKIENWFFFWFFQSKLINISSSSFDCIHINPDGACRAKSINFPFFPLE